MNKPLRFNIALGRTKPVNIRNEEVRCPFCDRSKLTDILDTSGHIIWLMNKYPVLDKTWPTVIIETETINGVKHENGKSSNQYSSSKITDTCLAVLSVIRIAKL